MTANVQRVRRSRLAAAATVLCLAGLAAGAESARVDWPSVGNDPGGSRYSPLAQVNRDNVKRLGVAWRFTVDDADPSKLTTIECTPLVVDGVMYLTTVRSKVVALNAATGEVRWTFDPYGPDLKPTTGNWIRASGGVNRGVAFWSDGKPAGGGGERRILLGASDGRLLSLDARTGKPDPRFGHHGSVDLRKGIPDRDLTDIPYGPTSAPAIFENTVIVGCATGEGHPAAPGDPRAFDVLTGKEVWRFHTIPRPGEPGAETWTSPDATKDRGGANPWSGFTVDAENGIVFMGTGSAGPDFYAAGRKGANLYANCTLALDARTGVRRWHFQTVHHDVWDHDVPCPPVLVSVRRGGDLVPAVAQVTKTGHCYVFERLTGAPLFDVEELPAPPSDVPGEEAFATQPRPAKPPPLARQQMREADVTDVSPEARRAVLDKLKGLRNDGFATPPSERGTLVLPGFHGGATWSGACFDPVAGRLIVNTNNLPVVSALRKGKDGDYAFQGYKPLTDDEGYPGIKPPWGLLTSIDLGTGTFAWQVPLGEYPELAARGVPQTGTENFGGAIVTAGGLVFIGGSKDERFRAYDKDTGRELWSYQLDAGAYATPSTYAADGRQFVVVAAGGGGKLRTRSGNSFVVFSLPASTVGPGVQVKH